MLHLFIFISTNRRDKCSIVSLFARNEEIANKLVNKKFSEWNYKGKPKRLSI